MSVRAPVGSINIANNDCCIGRGLSAINSKLGSIVHLYYILNDLRIAFDQRNAAGTTFGSITKEDLYSLPIIISSYEVIRAFDKICSPVFDRQMIWFFRNLVEAQVAEDHFSFEQVKRCSPKHYSLYSF